jgi:hypothetical protein
MAVILDVASNSTARDAARRCYHELLGVRHGKVHVSVDVSSKNYPGRIVDRFDARRRCGPGESPRS